MKYIIDTDPGIDDAIGIIFGYLNNLDIIGFTVATGNIEEKKAMNNLRTIQNLLGTKIKMFTGSIKNASKKTAEFAHGKDGLGNIFYPILDTKFEEESAEDFIIKAAKKYKKNLTIICLGPLTNIATALKKEPKIAKKISKIIVMGTAYNPNDEIPYAEFNIRTDPTSANLVLNSPFREIKLITHEIGVKSYIEKDYINSLKNSQNIISNFIYKISQKYMQFSYDHYKVNGLCSPDPTTIASLIDKKLIEFKPCKIEIKGNLTYINIVNKSNIYVSVDLDVNKMRDLFKKTFN